MQLAKLRGARVIAVCGRSKMERVRAEGADLILARDDGDVGAQLKAAVGERGATVVLDVVGGNDVGALWNILDRGGRYATGGAIGGPLANVDLRDLVYKDLQVFGIANPEPTALCNLVEYVDSGRLKPIVDQVFPLQALAEAHKVFASMHHVGKLVIDLAR